MECPHLEECARIAFEFEEGKSISTQLQVNTQENQQESNGEGAAQAPDRELKCKACQTKESPWVCLTCGEINCGRYVKGHAKEHFESQSELHSVCMDCHNLMAFCYKCDEFVINDTSFGHLEKLRKQYESLHKRSTHLQNSEKNQTAKRGKVQRRDSSDSLENERNHKKSKKDNKQRRPKTSGLRNLGNTCFMNAVLQSLSNIQEFCGYIKQLPSLDDKILKAKKIHISKRTRESGEDVLLVEELRKTLVALWQGTKGAISPESLFSVIWKVVPRFRGYQQQDAHEFMRYLLDRLHIELLELLPYPNNNSPYIGPKGKSTIVTAIFGGLLQSEVNCLICGVESKKHDPFLDLSLDIPAQFTTRITKPKDGEPRPICTLSDCLSSFTDVEELEDTELYMCNNCKKRQRSTKKFWIRRLPNVLCIHLKRFRWNMFCRLKVETFIDFPIQGLDMNTYVLNNLHETRGNFSGSNLYDLAAVIVHHGSGAGSGHYTAYGFLDGQWYHFNDSTVSACDVETVKRCKAYILFYVRREIRLPDSLCVRTNSSINGAHQHYAAKIDSQNSENSQGKNSQRPSSVEHTK